jgi:hypothetical protein
MAKQRSDLRNQKSEGGEKVNRALTFGVFLLLLSLSTFIFATNSLVSGETGYGEVTVGDRIASIAEQFLGKPYDPDPIGAYVRRGVIVYDDEVDCMYLTFRTVELALSKNQEDAIKIALEKRFLTKGILGPDGRVLNYNERYEYGEDMIDSGKFGREVTEELGQTVQIEGSRGRQKVIILPKDSIKESKGFKNGDIIFFVKRPETRLYGEIIGHIGILKVEGDNIYLIHASGKKNGKGTVKKVPFFDYVKDMDFAGIRVTRLTDP